MDVVAAANGIVEIANAAMVNALRLVSVQRGYDPREFVLIGFGGAGPLHANRLAAEMEVPTTLIPMSPGIFSALGLLVTDLKHDYATTMIQRVDALNTKAIQDAFVKMQHEGHAVLVRESVVESDIGFSRQVEMRYVGQSYELSLALPNRELTAEDIAALLEQFHRAHERAYGFSAENEPTEFVNLRLTAMGKIAKPELHELKNLDPDVTPAHKDTRPVYFHERNGYVDCKIYDRYKLGVGAQVHGPAIVEEFDSTTVIHPDYVANVDKYGNMFIEKSTKDG